MLDRALVEKLSQKFKRVHIISIRMRICVDLKAHGRNNGIVLIAHSSRKATERMKVILVYRWLISEISKLIIVRDPNLTIRATRSVSFEEEEKSPLDKKLIASTSNLKPNRSQSDFLNTTNNSFRTLKISQTESNRKSQFGRKSQLDAYEDM